MKLAIFDIDGTLTRTNRLDDACFVAAIRQRLRILVQDTDWSNYEHSTDEGLTREIWARRHRCPISDEHVGAVKSRFLSLMRRAVARDPDLLTPIPGATDVLPRMQSRGWAVAIATGAWRESAAFKLPRAGIRTERAGAGGHVPMACASAVTIDRAAIVRHAATISAQAYGCSEFERTVYIGDGVWDARAARSLGIGFVGVRADRDRSRLNALGVANIVEDLSDDALLERLSL